MTASVPFEPAQTEVEIAAIVPAARTDKTDALFMSGLFTFQECFPIEGILKIIGKATVRLTSGCNGLCS